MAWEFRVWSDRDEVLAEMNARTIFLHQCKEPDLRYCAELHEKGVRQSFGCLAANSSCFEPRVFISTNSTGTGTEALPSTKGCLHETEV